VHSKAKRCDQAHAQIQTASFISAVFDIFKLEDDAVVQLSPFFFTKNATLTFAEAADAHDDEDRGKRSKGDAEFRWARPMHDGDQQVSNNNSGNRIEPTTAVFVSRRVLGSFRRNGYPSIVSIELETRKTEGQH
jgi:hypothetical protein